MASPFRRHPQQSCCAAWMFLSTERAAVPRRLVISSSNSDVPESGNPNWDINICIWPWPYWLRYLWTIFSNMWYQCQLLLRFLVYFQFASASVLPQIKCICIYLMQIKCKLILFAIIELLFFITSVTKLYIWVHYSKCILLLLFTFHLDFGIQMILKLTKIKLNPFTTNPSEDISLNSSVKFGKCYSYIFKYDLQKDCNRILERDIFHSGRRGSGESNFFNVISL